MGSILGWILWRYMYQKVTLYNTFAIKIQCKNKAKCIPITTYSTKNHGSHLFILCSPVQCHFDFGGRHSSYINADSINNCPDETWLQCV